MRHPLRVLLLALALSPALLLAQQGAVKAPKPGKDAKEAKEPKAPALSTTALQDAVGPADTNGDLLVDDLERQAALAAFQARYETAAGDLLKLFDRNGDGKVDQVERAMIEEFLASIKLVQTVAPLDTDQDGRLSHDEAKSIDELIEEGFKRRNQEILARYDTNRDGIISNEERQVKGARVKGDGKAEVKGDKPRPAGK